MDSEICNTYEIFSEAYNKDLQIEINKNNLIVNKKDELISKLSLIENLKINQVICNGKVIDYKTYGSAFWRMYFGENRNTNLEWIKSVFNETIDLCESLTDVSDKFKIMNLEKIYVCYFLTMMTKLKNCLNNLVVLEETYKSDAEYLDELSQLKLEIIDKHNKLIDLQTPGENKETKSVKKD